MTNEELEHRLTDVENRSKSNTRRLDGMEKLTDAVNGMNTNIKLTIQQLETTNKNLENVTAQNKKQDDRLTALEKAPGAFGNKLWWAVIAAFISGFVAYELAALLHWKLEIPRPAIRKESWRGIFCVYGKVSTNSTVKMLRSCLIENSWEVGYY